jgi:regulator of replication initiation timing
MAEVRSGSKDAQIRSQIIEDANMMQAENKKLKLELDALRSRQQKTEVLMRDLRDELMQSSEDIRKSFILNEQVNIIMLYS